MKKPIAAAIILLFCSFLVSAGTANMQKIYPVDSEEYTMIKYLYIAQGHSLPSTTGPWSADELADMLRVLDVGSMDSVQKAWYDAVEASINARPDIDLDKFGVDFSGKINLELYFHTNTDGHAVTANTSSHDVTEKAFQGNHWVYDDNSQKSFLNFEMETYLTDHFYADFQADIANSRHSDEYYTEELGISRLSTNILGLKHLKFNLAYFDGNWPYRSFLSAGGDNWNIQIGRDKLSWGPGETGNLTISNNMPYQNFGRITAYSDYFKYTFLTSFYPHPINYWDNQVPGAENPHWHGLDNTYWGPAYRGLSMYIGHRLEARLFNDKLTIAGVEGLMYLSEDNTIDVRALNPLNFNHNNYIARNSNSTLEFEFNYTPVRGLNIYGEMIIDEIAFPGIETPPSAENRRNPTAMGFILGVKGVYTVGNGILHASAEFARTDPYLYLRDGVDRDNAAGNQEGYYGISYVVAIRNWSSVGAGITYDEYFQGYTFGPDAVVANLKAGWTTADLRLSVEGSLFYMAHGTHDAWTMWTAIGGSEEDYNANKSSPTDKHTSYNAKYDYKSGNTDLAVEKTLVCGINASYKVFSWLTAMVQADFVSIRNYGNIPGVDQSDFQLVASATFSF